MGSGFSTVHPKRHRSRGSGRVGQDNCLPLHAAILEGFEHSVRASIAVRCIASMCQNCHDYLVKRARFWANDRKAVSIRKAVSSVVGVACCLVVGCTKSPESTVQSFYRAVAQGEITEAESYLSRQVLGDIAPNKLHASLSREMQRVQRCGGYKELKTELGEGAEVRFGSVWISYAGNCKSREEKVKLIKEDGKWRLGSSK